LNSQTLQPVANRPDAVGTIGILLRDLIDYAGLFPPASLDMAQTAANYDCYLRSEESWILGRFIVPVARFGELEEAPAGLATGSPAWRLSAILGLDIAADVNRIHEFNHRLVGRATVESVEVKVTDAEQIRLFAGMIPAELAAYFEFPPAECRESIAAIADCRRRAKLRMGGETAERIPSPESVIEFIRLCAAANVPFKATAGLHHPLCSLQRLTYARESPSAVMHGFLNLLLAATFVRLGSETEPAVQLLAEQSAEAFHFDANEAVWRGHRLSRDEIAAARQSFAISFGSCSFTEPIADLRALHLL
jgi:hypothetical protein